jgi:hypothetical protein
MAARVMGAAMEPSGFSSGVSQREIQELLFSPCVSEIELYGSLKTIKFMKLELHVNCSKTRQ